MGLFDKKFCDLCGKKIGLLGNNKLADGNMCGDCEKKLAVWSTNHRNSTVAQIREQLADREENAKLLSQFSPNRELGGKEPFIKIDENMGRFVILRNGESMNKNPELLELDKVSNIRVDVKEETTELHYKDAQGHSRSYSPKHYHYRYRFIVRMDYNGKWFRELEFPLNTTSIDGGEDGANYNGNSGMTGISMFDQLGLNQMFSNKPQASYTNRDRLPGGWRNGPTNMREIDIQKYQDMMQAGNELTQYFTMRSMNQQPNAFNNQMNQGFQQPNQGWQQPNQMNQGFQQNTGWQQPNQFNQPYSQNMNQGLQNMNQGYQQMDPAYQQPNNGWQQPNQGFQQPNQFNNQPNQTWNQQQPNQQQPSQTSGTWTCSCGAVNSGNFCEYCGSRRP